MRAKALLLGLLTFVSGSLFAVRAPTSSAFLEWASSEDHPTGGFRPAPADLSHLGESYRLRAAARAAAKGGRTALKVFAQTIPESWDSRDHGWVTGVRDQNPYGTCWAHATMAALETSFLKGTQGAVTNDFSENHLATHDVGFLWGFDDGANDDVAAALLTAWRDPLLESEDPYPNSESTVDLPPACHVQEIVWIPERTFSSSCTEDEMATANEDLKRAVMDYGAVSVSYYHYWNNFNSENGAYYATSQNISGSGGGHAVTLIGWDDAYAVTNFVSGKQPPHPGAFLVKNSWGASSGDGGYTWISYYDEFFAAFTRAAAYPMPEDAENFGRIYQYDECGFTSGYNSLEEGDSADLFITNWCANVFTSVATGVVEAVGFYALSAGTEYEIRAYSGCSSDPVSGELVASQSGVIENAGFTTVRLETPMSVGEKEKFAIALSVTCPGTEWPQPVCRSEDDYCTTTARAGESFYSKDGVTWRDFQRFETTGNFCIKAYTRFGADGPLAGSLISAQTPSDETVSMWVGETNVFSVALVEGAGECSYAWSLSGLALDASGASLEFIPLKEDHGNRVLTCVVTDGTTTDRCEWSLAIHDELCSEDYDSLQAAVNAAIENDRVRVAPGVYPPLTGPSVTIEIVSSRGPAETVIDGGGTNRCYYGGYGPNTVLKGFTLAHGLVSDEGGVGGGAYGGVLQGCVITNCEASCGGGAYGALLQNSLVVGCRAVSSDGNNGCGGGALDCTLIGCTVVGNFAQNYSGGLDGGFYYDGNYSILVNSIVTGNSCTYPYGGNDIYEEAFIQADSYLVGGDAGFVDAAGGDYRLKVGSAAIDAGNNTYAGDEADLAGVARVFGPRADLGCYEYSFVPAGWPVPSVAAGASASEEAASVSAALVEAGFPASVASNVTTVVDYSKINSWADENGVTVAEQAASPTALLSPALAAEELLDLTSDDLHLSDFALGTNSTGRLQATLRLSLDAYDALKVDASLLKAAVGAVGSPTASGAYSSQDLGLAVKPAADAIEITVTPPEGRDAYFLKGTVR